MKKAKKSLSREHMTNLKLFADLVKELLLMSDVSIISARKKKTNPLVLSANLYIKALELEDCDIGAHHKLYQELYSAHRTRILKCIDHEAWMNDLPDSICVQIGKGTVFEKKNITLRISSACCNALKEKQKIDSVKYSNANEKELAQSKYEYQYVPLFYFRFLTVIRDSLGTEHRDSTRLTEIIEHYKAPAGLVSSESESEDSHGEGFAKIIKEASDGKSKIDGKGVRDALGKITEQSDVIEDITAAVTQYTKKEQAKKGKKGKKNAEEEGDMFADLARTVGPQFTKLLSGLQGGQQEESSGSESGSSTGSESE